VNPSFLVSRKLVIGATLLISAAIGAPSNITPSAMASSRIATTTSATTHASFLLLIIGIERGVQIDPLLFGWRPLLR
jgi:hypothetical protein